MAQQTINNGDTGLESRNKINENYTELYGRNGEANTASSAGIGESIVLPKFGVDLPFKSMIPGTNMAFSVGADAITFNATDTKTFEALTDAFTFSGNSLKAVRVNVGESALEAYTPSVADSDNIQDAAGTTGLFTEETANRLVGHSTGTGTALIFEMFEGTGTPVSVFQIDGNGNLFNNGNYKVGRTTGHTVILGTESTHSSLNYTGAVYNIFIGYHAGNLISNGDRNIALGGNAGDVIAGGYDNILIGFNTGGGVTAHTKNLILGNYAGNILAGSSNIFLGYYSGNKQTSVNNTLLINNYEIADAATELTDSLIYGLFNATASSQELRINAKLAVNAAPLTNQVAGDILLEGGSAIFKEITTPTADADYGKVYTKSDNKLYFQDGAGSEHSYFSNTGELGGADRTLGNTDAYDLGFLTNNINRLHIQNDGKVGIGTTSPTGTLHVVGDGANNIRILNDRGVALGDHTIVNFYRFASGAGNAGFAAGYHATGAAADYTYLYAPGGIDFAIATFDGGGQSEKLYIKATGQVGIGVTPLTNMAAGDLVLEGGSLITKEITTPTADANYGKWYVKADNKAYVQTGDGVENEIAFV